MKRLLISEGTWNWGGLLTTCGQDEHEYREHVCYGAMFDYAESFGRWKNAPDEYNDPEYGGDPWFELDKNQVITSYLYRYRKTKLTRARWWMNELATHIIPTEWFDSGLVQAEETRDFPIIEEPMHNSDIDWDSDEEDYDPRDEIRPMVRVDVSQKLPGQSILAVGALYRYMSECSAWLELYYRLRRSTKMTPSQCFIVASMLMPTDGHGVGVWRQLVAGSMFEEFKSYSLQQKFLDLATKGDPFYVDGCKRHQIDTFLQFNSKHSVRDAAWVWSSYSGNILLHGKKPPMSWDPLPIGDVHFQSRDVSGGALLLEFLKMEKVL